MLGRLTLVSALMLCFAAASPVSARRERNSPDVSQPAALGNPYISGAYIADLANASDSDGDGYYETYDFNIRIDADTVSGSATVAARIICTNTGQTWNTAPWTIYGIEIDWYTMPFDEGVFRGYISGPTDLDFAVELWDEFFSHRYETITTVIDEPFKVEPAPYISQTVISNVRNTVDADSDGYFEFFDFDIKIDADTAPGESANVTAKVICTNTGQSWNAGPWAISGSTTADYYDVTIDQSKFAGRLSGPTDLDFTVELWNPEFAVRYDTDTSVDNEPFKADPLPLISDVRIADVADTVDADADGFLESFQFKVRIDADMPGGSAPVAARIICTTTGQTWDSESWTVTGWAIDYHDMPFDDASFSGYLAGHTALDFTVEIWNPDFTRQYAVATAVLGEPFKAEPVYAISGFVRTVGGSPVPGVTVNGLPGNAMTDSYGAYSATVIYGWSGTVVPQKAGYDFCPSSRVYVGVTSNRSDQDYTAMTATPIDIAAAKKLPDQAEVRVFGVVTALFGDRFYVEDVTRATGIQLELPSHGRAVGERVMAAGIVLGSQAERYISTVCVGVLETGIPILPLGMATKSIGGTAYFYDPQMASGQQGVVDGRGPNNIGLFVRVWGKVTHAESGLFYVDDGCGLSDGSGHTGLEIRSAASATPAENQVVQVTGIVSCFEQPGVGLRPLILAVDIVAL